MLKTTQLYGFNVQSATGLVTSGLTLYLNAGDTNSYPGTGTTWTDLSGSGNNGTLQNSPTFNTTYFSFDGTNDFVSTTNSYTPAETTRYTVSAWFRTGTASGRKLIGIEDSQTGTTAGNYDKMLYMGTNGKIYFAQYPNAFRTIQSTNTLNDSAWHYAAGVYDGTNMNLYIDGVREGVLASGTSAMNTSGWWRLASYKLAAWPNAGDGYYTGDIAIALVYHRPLTSSEISQNFNAFRATFGV